VDEASNDALDRLEKLNVPHKGEAYTAGLIRYRYHPLCGPEVLVIRRCHGLCLERVIVELPDQTRCALPAWMLDEAV